MEGARLLGIIGRRKTLKPQQLAVVDAVNAGKRRMAVLMPRRSAKSTTIWAIALGRCATRQDYAVAYTQMTSGSDARRRFRVDVIQVLERLWPDEDQRPWRIFKASGLERIEFDNGSSIRILVPSAEAFRGDAYDLVVLDEAGEASLDMSEDILQGLLPTFDTRPGAQLIVAGTAAEFRAGNLLYESLQRARDGKAGAGLVEYASPDSTDLDELNTWEGAKALVMAAHPGLATEEVPDNLTTLEIAQERWEELSHGKFAREYLSIFGTVGTATSFLNTAQWDAHADTGALPDMPTDRAVGLAAVTHPDQSVSALVAAWRDDKGRACLLLVDHRAGTDWLPRRAKELASKLHTTVTHDDRGPILVSVETMERMRPRPKLKPSGSRETSTAAALLAKEIDEGNIVHWNQDELNAAVRLVTKRGGITAAMWWFGRRDPGHDIIAAEGASLALRWVDENPKRKRYTGIVA